MPQEGLRKDRVTYIRISEDSVEQTISFPEIKRIISQSELQKKIDSLQAELDAMPEPKSYPPNSTPEEEEIIDEWNIKNSNKFKKERLRESIDSLTEFLKMIQRIK